MELNTQQQEMLEGGKGPGVAKAMQILLAYGDCYNAERMIPITSVHIAGNYPVLMDEGIKWLEDLSHGGTKVSVYTTKNPEMFDFEHAEELQHSHDLPDPTETDSRGFEIPWCNTDLFVPPLFGGQRAPIRRSYRMGLIRESGFCQFSDRRKIQQGWGPCGHRRGHYRFDSRVGNAPF